MRLVLTVASTVLAIIATSSCATPASVSGTTPPGETHTLDGKPLLRPELSPEIREQRLDNLRMAREALAEAPGDLDRVIWVGRRTAYLGRYHEAIQIYTNALAQHPDSPALLRHRGHRYITVRRFGHAMIDLNQAAEMIAGQRDIVEEDGLPNARGVPTSTLHTNIYYHLGLAYYLVGEFDRAAETFAKCRAKAGNPDMLAATLNWEWASNARAGRTDELVQLLATVEADWDIIENHAYHRLLLLYRGDLDRDELLERARHGPADESLPNLSFASTAYGVANHALLEGDLEYAQGVLREIHDSGAWPAFGAIAAEVELHRNPQWRTAPKVEVEKKDQRRVGDRSTAQSKARG